MRLLLRGSWRRACGRCCQGTQTKLPPLGSLGCAPPGGLGSRSEGGVAAAGRGLRVQLTAWSRRLFLPPPRPSHLELPWTFHRSKKYTTLVSRDSVLWFLQPLLCMLLFRGRKAFSEASQLTPSLRSWARIKLLVCPYTSPRPGRGQCHHQLG